MKPLGTQHIAEFINCKKKILNNAKALERILIKSIEVSGLHYNKIISHKFNPVGVTVLSIISESHVGMHTYPEAGHVSLDVFTCSDAQRQIRLVNFLKQELNPRTVRIAEIQRGNPIEFSDSNWITSNSEYGFEVRYQIKKKIYSRKSKYQMIDIIENENFGRMLFLDMDLQIAEADADIYNKALVGPIKKSRKKINEVLILGGGDGGILHEILKLNPRTVTLVDIDEKVIEVSRKYLNSICHNAFEDPRVSIINDNAVKFVEESNSFDAIIYDLTMHPEAFTRKSRSNYLDGLFGNIKKKLNRRGVLTLQVGAENDLSTRKLAKEILSKYFVEINYYGLYVPSFCEKWIFASARVE